MPYDGSKYSKKALKRAIEVSDKLESTMHLLSVINTSYIKPPGSLLGLTRKRSSKDLANKIIQNSKKRAERLLKAEVAKCKKQGRAADYHIVSGNISEEILKFAKKKKISIIILGSQGLHGISKLKALGSTSRKISEFASCPVLIVR